MLISLQNHNRTIKIVGFKRQGRKRFAYGLVDIDLYFLAEPGLPQTDYLPRQ